MLRSSKPDRFLVDFQDLYREARQSFQAGDNQSAIEDYSQLAYGLMETGTAAIKSDLDLRNLLADAADKLVEILRWEGRYDEAIRIQERLIEFLPERVLSLRMSAANLRIEAGEEQVGLRNLREIAEADPENFWGWIILGAGYLWLTHYEEAEGQLRRAADLKGAEDCDRAIAYRYLFALYDIQKRVREAADAWERSCQLDPTLEATLPEVCRMFIYWRYLESAQKYLKRERSRLRRLFYGGLIAFENDQIREATEAWNKVIEYDPNKLTEGHDEFGEACIRLLRPNLALEVLEPMIKRQEINCHRLLVAGLAWAQRRIITHAKGALNTALRMADLERPRRTRPGGKERIFDARARILYVHVIIDPDIRQELDRYFIPGKS